MNDSGAINIIAWKGLSLTYKAVKIFELGLLQSGSNSNKENLTTYAPVISFPSMAA
jgi:hypothetical protein